MTVQETRPRFYTVRRVRSEEWENVRDLRLEALRDPVAHLAYLERIDEALQKPQSAWRDQTRAAATGPAIGQFVAVDDEDVLAGTVTALVTAPANPTTSEKRANTREQPSSAYMFDPPIEAPG